MIILITNLLLSLPCR